MAIETDTHREELRRHVNEIRDKNGDGPVEELSVDASLTDDYGLDSLALAELTVRLEDAFGVDVFADDVVDEVGEVLERLEGS